jgi:hypothetical protein
MGVTKIYNIVKEGCLAALTFELFHDLVVGRRLVTVDALTAERPVAILFVAGAVAGRYVRQLTFRFGQLFKRKCPYEAASLLTL